MHELEHETSAIYARNEPAWHRLGIVLPDEALTTETIIEHVPELGSTISPVPVLAVAGDEVVTSDRWIANVRDYDGKIVGVVSPTYQLVQPAAMFEFIEELLQQDTDAVWDTAMSLRDGSVVIGCLRLPRSIELAGIETERHVPYLMIGNSYDGSMALTVTISWVRAVCMNTVQWSIQSAARTFKLRHTQSVEGRMQEARDALRLAYAYGNELDRFARDLLQIHVTPATVGAVLEDVFPVRPVQKDEVEVPKVVVERTMNKRAAVAGHWATAENLAGVRNTGWGLLNAVTEWEQFIAHPNRKAANAMEAILEDSALANRAASRILALA